MHKCLRNHFVDYESHFICFTNPFLVPGNWCDQVFLKVCRTLWKVKITVINAKSLTEIRFNHDSPAGEADLVVVFNECGSLGHYSGASKNAHIVYEYSLFTLTKHTLLLRISCSLFYEQFDPARRGDSLTVNQCNLPQDTMDLHFLNYMAKPSSLLSQLQLQLLLCLVKTKNCMLYLRPSKRKF